MGKFITVTIILAISWAAVSAKCGDLVYRTKPSTPVAPPVVVYVPAPAYDNYAPYPYPLPNGPMDMVPMPYFTYPPVYVPTMQARPVSPMPMTLHALPGGGYDCYPTPNTYRIYPNPGMGYPQFLTNGYGYYQAPPLRYDIYNYYPPCWPPQQAVAPVQPAAPAQPEPDTDDMATAQ